MLPEPLKTQLENRIKHSDHPRELMIDVMTVVQEAYGYLSNEALEEAANLLSMDPTELEELATFYTFICREPKGKYVIRVCDSVICWMEGYIKLRDYLCQKLDIQMGQTTKDGLFTLLPNCCLGYCDRAPAMMINLDVYGPVTVEQVDEVIEKLRMKEEEEAEKKGLKTEGEKTKTKFN